jgi:hypothetical protein
MNLLFYNFNNSRANTAHEQKRAPSLGVENVIHWGGYDQTKQTSGQMF